MEAGILDMKGVKLMGFGLGSLFSIFAGAAWVAKEGIRETCWKTDYANYENKIKLFIESHTDPKLEEELKNRIEDPNNWVENWTKMWERIEDYKARGGKYYLQDKDNKYSSWRNVGKERLPIRDKNGTFYGKSEYENMLLSDNRNIMLYLLMQTYDKMTVQHATSVAEDMFDMPKRKSRF